MIPVVSHRVASVSEELRVLLKGSQESLVRDEPLVVVEGDAAVHRVPSDEDHLGLGHDVLGKHVDRKVGLDDPRALHVGRGLKVLPGHGLGGLLGSLEGVHL